MSEDRIGKADAADIFAMIAGEKGLDEKQKREEEEKKAEVERQRKM